MILPSLFSFITNVYAKSNNIYIYSMCYIYKLYVELYMTKQIYVLLAFISMCTMYIYVHVYL